MNSSVNGIPAGSPQSRKGVPKLFIGLLLACVVAVVLFIHFGPRKAAPAPLQDRTSRYSAGLALDQMRFDDSSGKRTVAGVVRNTGSIPAHNVTVSLRLLRADGNQTSGIRVTVPLVPAKGEVAFHTARVPDDAVAWVPDLIWGGK